MPPSPSMSNEKPAATLGWSSSQVTMSYVLLGVTLPAGGLRGHHPIHCHNIILERTLTTFYTQFQDWFGLKDDGINKNCPEL